MFILRLASAGRPPPMAGLGRTDGIGPPDPRTIRDGSKNPENARHAHRPDPRHPLVPLCEAYRYLGEVTEVVAARAPDLQPERYLRCRCWRDIDAEHVLLLLSLIGVSAREVSGLAPA
jgi:hypothetical protein